ncbi:avidin-like [Crotalus adamanteus]|uniref:Avidin-like n=1 Tax=Crotalus adamanteus TaxID=8729 RepID=A0AAW1C2U6_CROAD
MTVISHSNNAGVFSSFYLTALTATDNTIQPSPLQGIQHLGHQSIFGFVVKWNFSDENGEEHLKTALLLPAEVGSTAEDWKATRGHLGAFSKQAQGLRLFCSPPKRPPSWMELLQGRPAKTEENSPSLLWVSVLPLIRRGLQCVAGDLAAPVSP